MNIKQETWSVYRDKLLLIIRSTEQRNYHQFSDEIDQALSSDRAFLFVGEDGFFVLQPLSENGVVTVNVMFAFNWGGNAIERYQNMIEQLSREIGATGLELYTVVKSLVPLLEQQHWQLTNGDRIMRFIKPL
ncbi:hypothetical protein CTM97_20995 [Photobacterium phosphoreum]|uniref:Uncharacterized protein n=1 Tax=Photobacterium phosphoreum TaxID=659 RepID=A0A2T3JBD3_PHOPO|nr:hypothetical protein [Photobacterium phosphoreum]PSU19625.1 hypothetical protein CTM96_21040 [Photobacterium phosphoreum]PSU37060.1 hypothetical protein CTM97_20995 [Photobacterium phosphoreum]PSU46162.1 hypothetical protein C9J18_21090 [Photobacterium phosphoreum]